MYGTFGMNPNFDVLPTRDPSHEQIACADRGHGWRDGCHCDGGGFICRDCGYHGHYDA